MTLWTVYFNPSDFPGKYVARLWIIDAHAAKASDDYFLGASFAEVAAKVPPGLYWMPRQRGDDATIIGVWI